MESGQPQQAQHRPRSQRRRRPRSVAASGSRRRCVGRKLSTGHPRTIGHRPHRTTRDQPCADHHARHRLWSDRAVSQPARVRQHRRSDERAVVDQRHARRPTDAARHRTHRRSDRTRWRIRNDGCVAQRRWPSGRYQLAREHLSDDGPVAVALQTHRRNAASLGRWPSLHNAARHLSVQRRQVGWHERQQRHRCCPGAAVVGSRRRRALRHLWRPHGQP